ncbi:carbonic anhydrase [Agrobacterium sp. a22-2]|uniref:carbonic anhydrase n=1 Tax=Agrobacterium sp. a22-2 TaxID=2283840 RepID=UPI0014457D97|nr:carbonic anhydrase [Agrobacterium sp. a22-2]NKN39394.1 carbonic anhydrase [Agrobacterium sp. a22-2]
MCQDCETQTLNRRNLFKLAGVGLTAAALVASVPAHAATTPVLPTGTSPVTSPSEALARLKQGNQRFVQDAEACATHMAATRGELAGSQHPWATILTCSDSRVSPELVFGGSTLGELFVIRNAGNVLDTGALGTIEYGTEHLKSPLVVVMGHSKCGAITAACDEVTKGAELGGSIGKMVQPILPIVLSAKDKGSDLIAQTVRLNAISGARRIAEESRIVSDLVAAGRVKIVAAVYDITSGEVEFIEDI